MQIFYNCQNSYKVLCFVALLALMSACQSNDIESAMNKSQVIIYETQIRDVQNNIDWVKYIDSRFIVKDLFDRIENGSLVAYHPYANPGEESKYDWSDILRKMDANSDTIQVFNEESKEYSMDILTRQLELSEIKSLIFIEEWFFEKSTGKIVKEVLGIAPVRFEYFGEQVHKSVLFVAYFGDKMPPLFESYY